MFAVMAAVLVAPGAPASMVHAPHAPFAVLVDPESTIFNETIGFNGTVTGLNGSFGLTGVSGGGWVSTSGTVVAHFLADPGYAFRAVSLGFGPWAYSNAPFYAGHSHGGTWSIPGGVYVGDTNPSDLPGDTTEEWSGSGSSGSFYFARWTWWSGGGGEFRSIMGPWGTFPIELDYVTSFTVTLQTGISVANESGYGVSSFRVYPDIVVVPEPGDLAILLGLAAFGGVALGRRLGANREAFLQRRDG